MAALAADSVVFGLGHLYQGGISAAGTGAAGLAYALVYLRRRRGADAMVAHAGDDLIGVLLAYLLYARR